MVDEEAIQNYFFLGKRINKTRQRMRREKLRFDQTNYYPSTDVINGEVVSIGFRLETRVVNYVASMQDAEKHIEVMKFKLHHFNRFMKTLDYTDRRYYFSKYRYDAPSINERLDRELAEEIGEIEDAVGIRFFNEAAEQKINFNPFESEEDFEDSFSKMLELLGV